MCVHAHSYVHGRSAGSKAVKVSPVDTTGYQPDTPLDWTDTALGCNYNWFIYLTDQTYITTCRRREESVLMTLLYSNFLPHTNNMYTLPVNTNQSIFKSRDRPKTYMSFIMGKRISVYYAFALGKGR